MREFMWYSQISCQVLNACQIFSQSWSACTDWDSDIAGMGPSWPKETSSSQKSPTGCSMACSIHRHTCPPPRHDPSSPFCPFHCLCILTFTCLLNLHLQPVIVIFTMTSWKINLSMAASPDDYMLPHEFRGSKFLIISCSEASKVQS